MKRTAWLIPIYLLIAAAGVAGVMAFEAQLVNVGAEVSNSLTLSTLSASLGHLTPLEAHPKEWHTATTTVGLSASFTAPDQARVAAVAYKICAQPKPNTYPNPLTGFAFLWMGGAAFVQIDSGSWNWIGDTRSITPPSAGFICPGAAGTLNKSGLPANTSDVITIGLDVPVFAGQPAPTDTNRPAGAVCGGTSLPVTEPCVTIPVPPGVLTGTNLGMDLVLQVTSISP